MRAPFTATIVQRYVDLGSQVRSGDKLAKLVSTGEYWIRVSVPIDQLKWIRIPGCNSREGSSVRVTHEAAWGPGVSRTGVVMRLLTELEPRGRMAQLLVSVPDPLGLRDDPDQCRPLILGSYVRVEIQGVRLEDIVRVPRTALRDGNHVWIMDEEGALDIREVRLAWGGDDQVYVSGGVDPGERLIISDLGTPVQGMSLRTAEAKARPPGPSGSGTSTQPAGPKGERS